MRILTLIPAGITIAACCLLASPAGAGEFSAVINGKSVHLGASQEWNEENYGFGVEYEFAGTPKWRPRLMANAFRDSNDEISYMAGGGMHRRLLTTERWHGLHVDAGINAFLMTRRDVNDNRPFPGILPSLTVGNDFAGINMTWLPKTIVEKVYDVRATDESLSGILFLQLKIRL